MLLLRSKIARIKSSRPKYIPSFGGLLVINGLLCDSLEQLIPSRLVGLPVHVVKPFQLLLDPFFLFVGDRILLVSFCVALWGLAISCFHKFTSGRASLNVVVVCVAGGWYPLFVGPAVGAIQWLLGVLRNAFSEDDFLFPLQFQLEGNFRDIFSCIHDINAASQKSLSSDSPRRNNMCSWLVAPNMTVRTIFELSRRPGVADKYGW